MSTSPSPNLDKTPLKVLFVKDTLGKAGGLVTGGTTYFLEMLPRFDRTRIEPMLCILRHRDPVAGHFESVGIYPRFLSRNKWNPMALRDLLCLLREQEVDLLHLEGKKSLFFGRIAARVAKLPAIIHLHDMLPLAPWLRFLQRAVVPWTAAAIAVSNTVRDIAIKEYAIPEERVEVILNGHDIDRFATPSRDARSRIRGELGFNDSISIVGLIGRIINSIKGQELMIHTMPKLIEICPNTVLIIVGDGPDRQMCESLVKKLGLCSKVHFTGQRGDIPDLLAAMDVVAMPSLSEGFGYVALEAAAAGRPVVGFETGGISEVVVHGETGILVPKGNIECLANAIGELLKDMDLAKKFGEGGSQQAQRFTIKAHIQKLEEIYSMVVSQCSASRSIS